ncbi:hypothetical protein CPC735_001700, partial [Coccidioides posadasii C735 delta SOWgp]
MSSYPIQWDTILPVHQRQRLYSGISASVEPLAHEEVPPRPATIDLEGDTMPMPASLHAMIDIDSAGGLASSLAVAREGFQWKANRSLTSNLKSSLHLDPISVQWRDEQTERVRQSQRPVHQIPHLPFGRLVGFPEIEVYILFPRLFSPQRQHHIITEQEYALWTDKVFLPALHHVYSASTLLHLPSSAAHIQLSSTAARAEGRNQTLHEQPRVQEFHFSLQPAGLHHLWEHVQTTIQDPGLQHFQGLMLLLTAKNLKLSTQHATWSSTRDAFFRMWNQAVDGRYLTTSFYDIGKEVVSPWSFLSHQEPTHAPCTFIWRRCCLDCFCEWLRDSPAAQRISSPTSSEPDSSPDNSMEMQINNDHPVAAVQLRRSRRLRGHVQHRVTSEASDSGHVQHGSVEPALRSEDEDAYQPELSEGGEDEDDEDTSNLGEHSAGGAPVADAQAPDSEHEHPQEGSWRKQFYPLSFLRDLGSMTLEPHRCSPLRRRGLLYCQFYNTVKEVFAAGQHSPFANENLDTLALDPGLVRTWQHIGKAISHSPLALLRAYIHTKRRCHVAISDCRQRSYGTREEYRVTAAVLQAMDRILRESNLADHPTVVPQCPAPFLNYRTDQLLGWLRWNINKLCTGFEMVYSLQPRTVVHWEHTRVMMMFLRCLLCAYGGQGNHLCRSSGLWLDRRVQPPPEGSDTERIQEGLGMASTLELYGYAWFLDKLDWMAMTFKPPHRAHMVFNTPTLQMAYYRQYRQLIKFKSDFVLFHDVFSRMLDVRLDPARSALLLQLLVNLCLRAFRKDVFRSLADCVTQQPLHPARLEDACNGEIPLTCA